MHIGIAKMECVTITSLMSCACIIWKFLVTKKGIVYDKAPPVFLVTKNALYIYMANCIFLTMMSNVGTLWGVGQQKKCYSVTRPCTPS